MIKKIFIFSCLFILAFTICKGQKIDSTYKKIKNVSLENTRFRVDEQYRRASKLYEDARIDTALQILNNCVKHSISFKFSSKDTKADIYRLRAMSYLLVDSVEDARKNIKKMLIYRPFYKEENIVEDDLERFVDALDTLIASPQLYIGIRAGVNYSRMNVVNHYEVLEASSSSLAVAPQFAVNVGLSLAMALSKHFSVAFDPEFFQSKTRINTETQLSSLSSWQTVNYINLPVSFRANVFFNSRKTMPYFELGAYYSMLVSSKVKIDNGEVPADMYLKNSNYGVLLGLGFLQYYKNFGVGLNLRYAQNLGLNNDPSVRYLSTQTSNNLMYKYFQLTNDVKLSSLSLSLMFVYNIRYRVF